MNVPSRRWLRKPWGGTRSSAREAHQRAAAAGDVGNETAEPTFSDVEPAPPTYLSEHDLYDRASWAAFPPVGRALRQLQALEGMDPRDVEIEDVVYAEGAASVYLWPSFMPADRWVVLRTTDGGVELTDHRRAPMTDRDAAFRLRVSEHVFAQSRATLTAAMDESRRLFRAAMDEHMTGADDHKSVTAAAGGCGDVYDDDPVYVEGWEPRQPPRSRVREFDEYDDRVARWEAGLMAEADRAAELAERPGAELEAYAERATREAADDDGFGR